MTPEEVKIMLTKRFNALYSGTSIAGLPDTEPLTCKRLAEAMEALKPEVHYIASESCPETDEGGEPVYFYLKYLDAFVLHPNNLPLIAPHCRLVEYDYTKIAVWDGLLMDCYRVGEESQ